MEVSKLKDQNIRQTESRIGLQSYNNNRKWTCTILKALVEAGKKVLGLRRRKKEEWFAMGTWEKIEARKGKRQEG